MHIKQEVVQDETRNKETAAVALQLLAFAQQRSVLSVRPAGGERESQVLRSQCGALTDQSVHCWQPMRGGVSSQ